MPASKHHISDARAIVGEYLSFDHQGAVDLVNEIANGFAHYERQAFKRAAEKADKWAEDLSAFDDADPANIMQGFAKALRAEIGGA